MRILHNLLDCEKITFPHFEKHVLFSSIHGRIHIQMFPPHLIKRFQQISCMLHYILLVQTYLTFQAALTKTRTGEKPSFLKRLGGGPMGAKISRGDPQGHHG